MLCGDSTAQVGIFSVQWVCSSRKSLPKITPGFHDWVIERMIMSSTEIRTTEGEL